MNRYIVIMSSLLFSIFSGCTSTTMDSTERNGNAGGYQIYPNEIEQGNIRVEVELKDDLKKGELILLMNVKNNSSTIVTVDYTLCGLAVDAERVVVPETKRAFKTEIHPGEGEAYEIYYYPINSIDFYYRGDYRGDMLQTYSLKLDFIWDKYGNPLMDKGFTFKLPDSIYQEYLAKDAREKRTQIFDFEDENFAIRQKDYLAGILPEKSGAQKDSLKIDEDFIFASNPGITIHKMIVNIFSYKVKDTLMVNMRLLNEDSRSLKVLLPACKVDVAGRTYLPMHHFSDTFENGQLPDSAYMFKPGTRLHLLLKYYIPESTDQFEFDKDWLLIRNGIREDEWVRLFYKDLHFRESPITSDPIDGL